MTTFHEVYEDENGEFQIGVEVREGECGLDWSLEYEGFTGFCPSVTLAYGQDCETPADVVEDVRSVLNGWVREIQKAIDTQN